MTNLNDKMNELEALAELRGFDAAYKIMKKREEKLIGALREISTARCAWQLSQKIAGTALKSHEENGE